MKKLILAAIASTLVASPIALAAPAAAQTRESTTVRQRPDGRTVVTQRTVTRAPGFRTWRAGDRFDRRYAQNYRVVNYRTYRFAAPRRGQQWVRSGRDAVLIDARGNVIRVQPRAFR